LTGTLHSDATLTSWGRVVRERHHVARPRFVDDVSGMMWTLSADSPGLAVGLRRSYGDSNLSPDGRVIDMTGLDRIISFNRRSGFMRAEAGLSLSQALQVLVPAGWFLPTTPGTRFVTLGLGDTPITEDLKKGGLMWASADQIVKALRRAAGSGGPIRYAPGKWRIVMAIIRAGPAFVFHKTKL
jgi:hypothetical protein